MVEILGENGILSKEASGVLDRVKSLEGPAAK